MNLVEEYKVKIDDLSEFITKNVTLSDELSKLEFDEQEDILRSSLFVTENISDIIRDVAIDGDEESDGYHDDLPDYDNDDNNLDGPRTEDTMFEGD